MSTTSSIPVSNSSLSSATSNPRFQEYNQIWSHYLRKFHKAKALESYFKQQSKQKSHLRVLDITSTSGGVPEIHTYDDDDKLIQDLSEEFTDELLLRIIEVEELPSDITASKPSPPTLRLSHTAVKFIAVELDLDPLIFLWNEPQPPFLGDNTIGIRNYSRVTRETTKKSALIAQTIPKATLSEATHFYNLDKNFRCSLTDNSLLHGVPYRMFFTTKKNAAVILVIPYKGCDERPIDLACSPQFRWDEIIRDPATTLPTGQKLMAYYIQMTLEEVTAGWSRSTSWFSKQIAATIRKTAYDPDYAVGRLTDLSLEGFKCLEMAMALHQWSRVVEGYSKSQTGELFLKDGWDRLNTRFEIIFQKHELLEKQMTNAHTMISARINLQDARSMNRLACLGALFLPGAFLAAFFGMNLDSINDSPLPLWLFFATALPATALTFVSLFYGRHIIESIVAVFSFLDWCWGKVMRHRTIVRTNGKGDLAVA